MPIKDPLWASNGLQGGIGFALTIEMRHSEQVVVWPVCALSVHCVRRGRAPFVECSL